VRQALRNAPARPASVPQRPREEFSVPPPRTKW
jgi:hypothetical protein